MDDMTYWIDSIHIISEDGMARIINIVPVAGGYSFDSLAVITNSDLSNPVTIDPEYDRVKVRSWIGGDWVDEMITLGSYPGSYLDCFNPEESICGGEYALRFMDSSPSMGFPNSDTAGTTGMFSGTIYDPQGAPLVAEYFTFYTGGGYYNESIAINPDGSFGEPIRRRHNSYDEVWVRYSGTDSYVVYRIEAHDYCMEYGYNHHHQDIITLFAVGIENIEGSQENMVIVHPNPFREEITFTFDQLKLQGYENLMLRVSTLEGKPVEEIVPGTMTESFKWSPNHSLPAGVLVYQLFSGNKLLSSGKMIKQ